MELSRSKNIIKYVIPTVLSGVCFFLFTIIDGIFVGHGVGTDALGAVNIAFPYVMAASAVLMLTTIGGVTVVAIRLGRGDSEGANAAFMHSTYLTLGTSALMCLIGTVFAGPVVRLLGADETFFEMARDYLFWYSLFLIPSGLSLMLQGFCRNDGSPVLVSVAVAISTALNIFGDWLLIFPIPMGLKGAAIATGVSQSLSLFVILGHFIKKKGALRFKAVPVKPALFRKIVLRGAPECIAQLSMPVTTMCMNLVLVQRIGDIAVNSFSVICYVASFSLAVFFGTGEGLQPLFGRCYGAKNDADLKFYFRAGLIMNFVGSVFINILLLIFGGGICRMFGVDDATLDFTVRAMPVYASGFIVMAFNVMISAYLYSTKRSKQAIIINLLRSFIVNSAVIFALPAIFGAQSIWAAFAVYEALVLIAAVILLKHSERNGIVYK